MAAQLRPWTGVLNWGAGAADTAARSPPQPGVTVIHFDCHAHVYETVRPSGTPRYVPAAPAPLATWRGHLATHRLAGGVLVQPSFFATDNSELLRALNALDRDRFAGVAVLGHDASAHELAALAAAGVRGVRWNLIEGGTVPDIAAPEVTAFLQRLADAGLHLEIHLEGPRLAKLLPQLAPRLPRLVIDHFGRPTGVEDADSELLTAVRAAAAETRLFVKFSAPYRVPLTEAYRHRLLDAVGEDRTVWGSDWPFTRHEGRFTYADVVDWQADHFAARNDAAAVKALYGLATPPRTDDAGTHCTT